MSITFICIIFLESFCCLLSNSELGKIRAYEMGLKGVSNFYIVFLEEIVKKVNINSDVVTRVNFFQISWKAEWIYIKSNRQHSGLRKGMTEGNNWNDILSRWWDIEVRLFYNRAIANGCSDCVLHKATKLREVLVVVPGFTRQRNNTIFLTR